DYGPDDAPEKYLVLECRRDLEIVKDQEEDEDVVDAQGLLDEEAGEKLQARLAAALVEQDDADVEEQGQAGPDGEPGQRLFRADHVRPTLDQAEVQRQHHQNETGKPNPQPDVHEAVLWSHSKAIAADVSHRGCCPGALTGSGSRAVSRLPLASPPRKSARRHP